MNAAELREREQRQAGGEGEQRGGERHEQPGDGAVGTRNACSSASKVNHSLTKPPNGGIAARVRTARPNAVAVRGSIWPQPAERSELARAGGARDAFGAEEGEGLRDARA